MAKIITKLQDYKIIIFWICGSIVGTQIIKIGYDLVIGAQGRSRSVVFKNVN